MLALYFQPELRCWAGVAVRLHRGRGEKICSEIPQTGSFSFQLFLLLHTPLFDPSLDKGTQADFICQ